MSNQQLSALKEQLASLTPEDKLELAKFLTEQAEADLSTSTTEMEAPGTDQNIVAIKRAQHLAWLKAHREQYAGQYVALDGDRLAGCGSTIREAHEQARQQGVDEPFLVYVSSVEEAPFGGW
jgi:hypothetical protein